MSADPNRATVPAIELTSTDLKQWSYCHRIPFYRYVLPVDRVRTHKMKRGQDVQDVIEALERRRRFREYGLREGERHFGLWLRSERLGLSGKIDLLIKTPRALFPVDFKDTEGGVRRNHRVQLAAYALLAEETFGRATTEAFVYLVPQDEIIRIQLTTADRTEVLQGLADLRRMIATEVLPEATSVRARCTACEFRNYCGDIW